MLVWVHSGMGARIHDALCRSIAYQKGDYICKVIDMKTVIRPYYISPHTRNIYIQLPTQPPNYAYTTKPHT